MSDVPVKDKKYCVECGREKKTMIFRNDDYCSEACRKSIVGEGPKRGFSEEWMEREKKAGNIVTVEELYEQATDLMRRYHVKP